MYSGCDVSGKFTFLDIQRQVLDAVVGDGEVLMYIHEGRLNPHGIQLVPRPINYQYVILQQ